MFYKKQESQEFYERMDKFNEKIALNNMTLQKQKRILHNKISYARNRDSQLSNIKEALEYAFSVISVIEIGCSIVAINNFTAIKIVVVLFALMVLLGFFYIFYCFMKRQIVNDLCEYRIELYYVNEAIQKKSQMRVKKHFKDGR